VAPPFVEYCNSEPTGQLFSGAVIVPPSGLQTGDEHVLLTTETLLATTALRSGHMPGVPVTETLSIPTHSSLPAAVVVIILIWTMG
jgi:hypothetical protein